MPTEFELPFDELNQAPFLSGIDPFVIEIPTPEDIADAVVDPIKEAVPTSLDIQETVRDVFGFFLDEFDDFGDMADDIVDRVGEQAVDVGLEVEDLADELASQIDIGDPQEVSVDLEGSLFQVEDDLEEIFRQALIDLDTTDIIDPEELAPTPLIPGPDREEDIEEAGDVAEDVVEKLRERLLTELEDFEESEAFETVVAATETVLFAVANGLVSEGARNNLQTALEEV